jgi:hypothetical protein
MRIFSRELTCALTFYLMRKFFGSLFLLFTFSLPSFSQSILFDEDTISTRPLPGLYLNFESFYFQKPIELSRIQTGLDIDDRDFCSRLVEAEEINIVGEYGQQITVPTKQVWAYSDGKYAYLNRKAFPEKYHHYSNNTAGGQHWTRINIPGTLSVIYLYDTRIIRRNTAMPGVNGVGTRTVPGGYESKTKVAEFILDTRNGYLTKATLKNFTKMIADDNELLQELKSSSDDRETKLYIFLKKYNQRHLPQ